MMYGHVDNPRHWVGHLRVLPRIQDETGGFTEFVPLPFVHHSAPIYLAGVARPGPTHRDNLAVHALARILLHGRIDNIQTSWVKLGVDGTRAMLQAGANDLGGTLMEETISRMAGLRARLGQDRRRADRDRRRHRAARSASAPRRTTIPWRGAEMSGLSGVSVLLRLWEQSGRRLRERCRGLTDAEFFWEPVPDCWNIRPDEHARGWLVLRIRVRAGRARRR